MWHVVFNPFSSGIDFSRQNLTSLEKWLQVNYYTGLQCVVFWRNICFVPHNFVKY